MKAYLLFIPLLIVSCNAVTDDAIFNGYAVEQLGDVGAWGWIVSVDKVISGPEDLTGKNISVYMTSANPREYPPGFIDPNIAVGDRVSVYGWLQSYGKGDYHVLLVGNDEYYIKPEIQEGP